MRKRKEEALKNYPGISKIFDWNFETQKWEDIGKFRAMRRISTERGQSKKESAFFDSLEEAKSFRSGKIVKHETGLHHKDVVEDCSDKLRFGELVEEWKRVHFLTIDYATQQTYEKKIPPLDFLSSYFVEDLTPKIIDEMILHWRKGYSQNGSKSGRTSFEKELDALKVILNYYQKRVNQRFFIPIFKDHYQASIVVRKAKRPVRALRKDDLGRFLKALREQKNPIYYFIALVQFGLGLRIGEACGLSWKAIDLRNRIATIEQTIVWDSMTWRPRIKLSPKNGEIRYLSIPDFLVEEFDRLKAVRDPKQDLIFHSDGYPMNRQTVAKAYNRALDTCEIHYVRGTHLMRKTSATQANRVTGDFYAVSKNLGHSSVEETQKYVEEVDESKIKVARALDQVAREVLFDEDKEANVVRMVR